MNGKYVGPIAFQPLDLHVFKRGNKDILNITGKEDFGDIYSIAVSQKSEVRNEFANKAQWMLNRVELSKVDLKTGDEIGTSSQISTNSYRVKD